MPFAISVRAALLEAAANLLNEQGYDATIQPQYSGRGMFGARVAALVTSAPAALVGMAFMQACIDYERTTIDSDEGCDPDEAVQNGITLAWESCPKRVDNMGRDAMVYY